MLALDPWDNYDAIADEIDDAARNMLAMIGAFEARLESGTLRHMDEYEAVSALAQDLNDATCMGRYVSASLEPLLDNLWLIIEGDAPRQAMADRAILELDTVRSSLAEFI